MTLLWIVFKSVCEPNQRGNTGMDSNMLPLFAAFSLNTAYPFTLKKSITLDITNLTQSTVHYCTLTQCLISSQIFFIGNFFQITINFISPCTLTAVFYWLPYQTASYLFTVTHTRFIQMLVMHHPLWIHSRKERNTHVYCS